MTSMFTESLFAYKMLLLTAVSLPFLLAFLLLPQRLRSTMTIFAPWAALPALLLSLSAKPGAVVSFPWLLFGAQFGVDATAQVFLLFTALLWTCAGVYACGYLKGDAHASRFFTFFLTTMSGNIGLILAQDIVTFYLFFALMGFTAYGLVIHDGSSEARRAGKIYLILVIGSEIVLVPGLLLVAKATEAIALQGVAASIANASTRDLIIALILVGFGIKVGVLPLHVWLPLAHPVAPTPASAVLSGAMIKAGLLGWLRFLPLGDAAFPTWGGLCIAAGLMAAFYGVAVGLTQDNPKTALAYSSISQMGFMTVGVGVGLSAPETWPATLAAILSYALHHGLAKGALFLGVGVARSARREKRLQRLIFIGLLLPALALAGAPLTSGAAAKLALKSISVFPPAPWPSWIMSLLPLTAVGTTLLMGRFLFLLRSSPKAHGPHLTPRLWAPWATLIVGVLTLSWFFIAESVGKTLMKTLTLSTLWPVLVGSLLSWAAWQWQGLSKKIVVRIPPGDLLVGVDWLWGRRPRMFRSLNAAGVVRQRLSQPLQEIRQQWLSTRCLPRLEEWFSTWASAGLMLLALLAAVFSLLTLG